MKKFDTEKIATTINHVSEGELNYITKKDLAEAIMYMGMEIDKIFGNYRALQLSLLTFALENQNLVDKTEKE